MPTLLLFTVLTLVALSVAGAVVVRLALGALVWLMLLPFRLLFSLGGLVLGVRVAPLVRLVLLLGFGWVSYRLFVARRAA